MPDVRKCSCCGRYFTPSENGVDIVSHNDGKQPASIEKSLCYPCYEEIIAYMLDYKSNGLNTPYNRCEKRG